MYKLIVLVCLILSFSTSVFAEKKCKDLNLDGLSGEHYNDLQNQRRFRKLFQGDSPAPVGYSDIFGEGESACKAVEVTFLEHIQSNKIYAIYTTHDDYCDGGNTLGIVIDTKKYRDLSISTSDAVVGRVGDGEFNCNKK